MISECFLESKYNLLHEYQLVIPEYRLLYFTAYKQLEDKSPVEEFLDVIRNEMQAKQSVLRAKSVTAV